MNDPIHDNDHLVKPDDWSRADWEMYLQTGEEPAGKNRAEDDVCSCRTCGAGYPCADAHKRFMAAA